MHKFIAWVFPFLADRDEAVASFEAAERRLLRLHPKPPAPEGASVVFRAQLDSEGPSGGTGSCQG